MTLAAVFERLKTERRAAFIPFFAAGDPDLATTAALVKSAAEHGADIVELGIPFSDPIADGPVIQAAFNRALAGGFRVAQAFDLVAGLRAEGCLIPIVCMVSYTLVFKLTLPVFLRRCRETGFNGLIIPDLPVGYEGNAAEEAASAGVDLIFLAAPTTPPERRAAIAARSRGFIYYVSVAGTTGERTGLAPDIAANISALKASACTPVCVGFGISTPEQAAAVAANANGVIVGSALVRKVSEALARQLQGPALAQYVGNFMGEFAKALRGG
jgi:tryptophan synthase alpha chain